MTDKKIILFDGLCTFCSFWAQFAFKRNKKRDLFYMSLQDERTKKLLAPHGINPTELSTVIFYNHGVITTQSTAAFTICKHLDGGWKVFSLLLVIPKFIRDFFYNFVAKRRYKWFGKSDQCMMPSPEMKSQFI